MAYARSFSRLGVRLVRLPRRLPRLERIRVIVALAFLLGLGIGMALMAVLNDIAELIEIWRSER